MDNWFRKTGLTSLTALSRSQSLKMMSGDLPPSSRDTFLTLLSAALCVYVVEEDKYTSYVIVHN